MQNHATRKINAHQSITEPPIFLYFVITGVTSLDYNVVLVQYIIQVHTSSLSDSNYLITNNDYNCIIIHYLFNYFSSV